MVFFEVIAIEGFVVVKIYLYLLIHLAQLQLDHEFPLIYINLQVIDPSLCLLLTSKEDLLFPWSAILTHIDSRKLMQGLVISIPILRKKLRMFEHRFLFILNLFFLFLRESSFPQAIGD